MLLRAVNTPACHGLAQARSQIQDVSRFLQLHFAPARATDMGVHLSTNHFGGVPYLHSYRVKGNQVRTGQLIIGYRTPMLLIILVIIVIKFKGNLSPEEEKKGHWLLGAPARATRSQGPLPGPASSRGFVCCCLWAPKVLPKMQPLRGGCGI